MIRRDGGRLAALALAVVVAALVTSPSQAAARGAGSPAVTTSTGTDAPAAAETVDGVPVAQAPGIFQHGTPVSAATGVLPLVISPGVMPLTAPSGCRDAGVASAWATDIFGVTVWKIWNHTHWCYSNWDVTSVTGWTDTYTAVGWSASSISWGWGWWSSPHTAYSTSHAHFCLASYFGCLQTGDPNVHVWINGDGHYSFDDSTWY